MTDKTLQDRITRVENIITMLEEHNEHPWCDAARAIGVWEDDLATLKEAQKIRRGEHG